MNNKLKIKKLVATASLLAIAIVLDVLIGLFNLRMPFGGSLFGISMIPLVLIGLFFGLRYGLFAGLIYAIYNFSSDYIIYLDSLKITLESWTGEKWTVWKILLLVTFDYIIPFMAYGLSGLFSKSFKQKYKFVLAFIIIGSIRLMSSTLSGVVFWSSSIKYASSQVSLGVQEANIATKIFSLVGNNLWLYSLSYNFIYIFTTVSSSIIIGLLMYERLKLLKEQYFSLPN